MIKTPFFSSNERENPEFLGANVGYRNLIMPRVIPKAEKANTVPRSPYTHMVRPNRWAMAMSMARYRRGPHYRGRVSERGLALT